MTGRILIVDDVATNRIVMKVKLAAACYAVDQAACGADALAAARRAPPDLILLDVLMPDMSGLEVCRRLKADPVTADIPVILITALADRDNKMAGLEAGADDFLTKPVDEVTLLARVRSLLRARDTVRELRERGEPCAGLEAGLGAAPDADPGERPGAGPGAGRFAPAGLAEAAAAFSGPSLPSGADPARSLAAAAARLPGRIALVGPGPRGAVLWKSALDTRLGDRVEVMASAAVLADLRAGPDGTSAAGIDLPAVPDVYVLAADLGERNAGLRLLSELRSRPATRHAATVMILPQGESERAAIALDLGASDILYDPVDAQELAIRVRAQLGRKRQADRLREGARTGLELAVTDDLTGLANRRYALYRLDRMLARPGPGAGLGPGLAVMMLDLDFFKAVNDRHGHLAGDRVLRRVARRLRAELRPEDLVARIGGEEFLVALPDTREAAAIACAERLRAAVGARAIDLGEAGAVPVTLSVRLAMALPGAGDTAEAVIARADRALYGAKAGGRNTVTLAANLPAA